MPPFIITIHDEPNECCLNNIFSSTRFQNIIFKGAKWVHLQNMCMGKLDFI